MIKMVTFSVFVNNCYDRCAERSNFKLYMGDTGLLVTQMMRNSDETGDNLYKSLVFDKLGINQGMIIENMVAQMLRASGHDLYNKSPSAEYEFHTLRKGIFSERIFL